MMSNIYDLALTGHDYIVALEAENERLQAELEQVTAQYKGQRTAARVNWDKQRQLKAELEKVRAELEKCQQDAFNSGRDVQHRIDGRESAGFAELPY